MELKGERFEMTPQTDVDCYEEAYDSSLHIDEYCDVCPLYALPAHWNVQLPVRHDIRQSSVLFILTKLANQSKLLRLYSNMCFAVHKLLVLSLENYSERSAVVSLRLVAFVKL